MDELSIIILTHNQRELTLHCLESIAASGAEIILVDNGSTDSTADEVHRRYLRVKILRNNTNLGVAAARNIGVEASSRRWIMLLDNDTQASPSAIETLIEYLEANPTVGLVAPALYSVNGELQESFKPFPGLFRKIRHVLTHKSKPVKLPDSVIEPFYVIGAAQLFSREVWRKAGPLDEKIFYGPEDADFCIRVRKAGYKVVYLPTVSIIHHWQRATTHRLFSKLGRAHILGLLRFYLKHGLTK